MKLKLQDIDECTTLYRDSRTGLAWVEDGHTGSQHSAHPNIDASGSVRGMKKLGYWGELDNVVRCRGTIYNISRVVVDDELDELARQHCQCGGNHG